MAAKSEEIQRLNSESKVGLDQIRSYIGHPRDLLNKAGLFENDVKTDGHIFAPKVVAILVKFNRSMELI